MTFPDFLIFVSRRKAGNGVLKLFDEYDKGLICSKFLCRLIWLFADGSARLDAHEVQYWLENHGKYITIRQAQKIIDQMDFNGDGFIEYNDFLATILGMGLATNNDSNVVRIRPNPLNKRASWQFDWSNWASSIIPLLNIEYNSIRSRFFFCSSVTLWPHLYKKPQKLFSWSYFLRHNYTKF